MNEEIRNILNGVRDGEKIIAYIEALEEHLHHHHHDDNCDCGCHDEDDEEEWKEVKTPYKNHLSVKDWEKLLKDKTLFTRDALIVLKRMRHVAAPTDSMELADTFGLGALYYAYEMQNLAERLVPYVKAENLKQTEQWSILFKCWELQYSYARIFGLIPELYEALGNVDLSDIPLRENEV
ncbi:MAG: hypothetical protein K6C94_03720 [Candidatus Gastranaerophilales bacterium]|nr:hypothetical protein [Candidatus Gastranaerophilales bacterium]